MLSNETGQRSHDTALLSVHSTSPATQASTSGSSVQLSGSTSTPRSLSVTTSQSSNSRHGSFQQPQTAFMPGTPSSALSVPGASLANQSSNLAAWRSHESGQSVHPAQHAPVHVQDAVHHQPPVTAYSQANPAERVDWAPQTYQYGHSEHQQPQKYEAPPPPAPPPQQQQPYLQTPVQSFAPAPGPPPLTYHPPQLPPQAEFQNMAVSSPASYQMPQQSYQQPTHQQSYPQPQQQQGFQQPASYQMTPLQVPSAPAGYVSPHGEMQPPPLPTTTYHAPPQEQHYAQQPQPPMQYRDDAGNRSYSLAHYPSG